MRDLFNEMVIVAAGGGAQKLVDAIQAWIGPIFLLAIGIIAITFLFKRSFVQFAIFVVIAILIAVLFYAPGVLINLASMFFADTGVAETSSF
jgi:hypothetical protein